MATRKRRRRRVQPLLTEHLEGVSWRILDDYRHIIREMIRGRAGVYALYKRDKLLGTAESAC